MAKSVKKKTNRRLKRSVRRTLGALCMMTAIIVAAIPFPDAAASNGVPVAQAGDVTPYSYNQVDGKASTNPATFEDLVFEDATDNANVQKEADSNGTAYTISNVSGDWQMDWQFKYNSAGDGKDGFITQYNNQYQVDEIYLQYRVFSDYISIATTSYADYGTSMDEQTEIIVKAGKNQKYKNTNNDPFMVYTLSHQYTLNAEDGDGDGTNDSVCLSSTTADDGTVTYSLDLTKAADYSFYTDPDNNMLEAYESYKTQYNAYLTDPTANAKPEPLIKTYRDVYPTTDQQIQFLCDQVFGTGTPMSLKFVDERTYNENGEATGWQKVYVPCLANVPSEGTTTTIGNATYYFDSNGFLADKFNTISGIAKGAFKGVGNVKTLTMAEQISFIGNSAFEDSFIQSVTLPMDSVIGNQAFKNCGRLTSVSIPVGVEEIGAEAFYGTSISSITIPDTIRKVGDGAFANCGQLQTVTFDGNSATQKDVGDFAFYDCLNLSTVNFGDSQVARLGDCAFAVSKVVGGNMTNFDFPHFITDASSIGKYLFGGRDNLSTVTMPKNLGTSVKSTLDASTFYGCNMLSCVTFPDSCINVSYEADMFRDVVNEQFYVRGPKAARGSSIPAAPRTSTWDATYCNGAEPVPYVYNDNGADFFEIKDDDYISVIDQSGVLVSSRFFDANNKTLIGEVDTDGYPKRDETTGAEKVYKIPGKVGTTYVVGIQDGCFEDILDWIVALKIEDDSKITSIGDNVFSGAKELQYIYVGDSVQSIGSNAFSKCDKLAIAEIGSGVTTVGASAFEGCGNLTQIFFDKPTNGAASFPLSNIGENAFSTGLNSAMDAKKELTIYGFIDGSYGPFAWAMQPDNYMDAATGVRVCYKSPKNDPQGMTVILDNSNNLPTLIDYPKYNEIDKAIRDKLEGVTNESITPSETAIVNAALNIVVPNGVQSIDSKGYFESDSMVFGETPKYTSNKASIETYFTDPDDNIILSGGTDADGNPVQTESKYSTQDENKHGLFSSGHESLMFESAEDKIAETKEDIMREGNDSVQSITLTSVKYLPEDCFYSCEGLQTIDLGSEMTTMDPTPFRGCTAITSIASGNGKYACNNAILYENLSDGTKKIVECLPSRGGTVGSPEISSSTDPDLLNVSVIAESAFSECPYITDVNFMDTSLLDEISDSCFEGSSNLGEVNLGENVQIIGERAFAETDEGIKVYVYGREVSLGKEAFDGLKNAFLISYENSGVRKAAQKQGVDVSKIIPENSVQVTFKVWHNGSEVTLSIVPVEVGSSAKREAPLEDEMTNYIPEGYELYGWKGVDGANINDITKDSVFWAQIVPEDGLDTDGDGIPDTPKPDDKPNGDDPNGDKPSDDKPNGDDPNGDKPSDDKPNEDKPSGDNSNGDKPSGDNQNGGNTGNNNNSNNNNNNNSTSTKKYTLTVVYGNGSGTYASGSTVIISAIEPPAGKEFYKWTTNNTGVTITSASSAATTVKTTNSDAVVTATYRDKSSVSSNSVNRKPIGSSGSTVQISKPGISNTDKAYASVSGSTDNFVVKITESTAAANAVATALSNEYYDMNPIKYFAMDISLYDKNGNQVTNTNGLSVNVTMPIPDALVQYGGNNKVGAVVNGNTLEKLNCKFTTVSGIPCVTFTATHFSPYTIYVDTSNLSVNTLDSTPKTGDGIHPKWFFSIGLACISLLLFMKKDKVTPRKALIS